jgi:hypothetical protein
MYVVNSRVATISWFHDCSYDLRYVRFVKKCLNYNRSLILDQARCPLGIVPPNLKGAGMYSIIAFPAGCSICSGQQG